MHFRLIDLDPRSFWSWLPLLLKLFVLFLLIVTAFVLYSLLRILWTTRWLQKAPRSDSSEDAGNTSIRAIERRLANLAHLLLFVSCLFGFLFFFQLPYAFEVFGDYKTFPWGAIFKQLGIYFVFAADVFLLLLVLHSLRWIASSWFHRVSESFTIEFARRSPAASAPSAD